MKVDFSMFLTALDWPDAEKARVWRNDWRIMQWTRQSEFISDRDQRAWFDRQAADPTIKMYAVRTRCAGTDELVGVCGLTSIDWLNRRAEFSLYIAPNHQRCGYGREALKLLLKHGFENLGLNQIWGETFEGNPAIKLFAEIGMKLDGMRRDFYWKDGKFLAAHLISILAKEWIKDDSATDDKPGDSSPGAGFDNEAVRIPPGGLGGETQEAEVVKAATPIRKQRTPRPAP